MTALEKVSHRHFYAPRYWLAWLGVGLLWVMARLPYAWQLGLGQQLGKLLYWCSPKLRRTTQINISLCFSDLTAQQQHELVKKNFTSLGISLFETAAAWWAPATKLQRLIHMHGMEHLDNALQNGKGVIILGYHFTTIELVGRLLAMQRDFAAMYNPHKKPFLAMLRKYIHEQHYHMAIPRDDLRALIKCLKKNMPVLYAPDIDAGTKNSVFVPFMGVLAATVTATARLAKVSGAALLPIGFFRREDGQGYDITFYPALENYPTDNDEADARRMNEVIEQFVKQKPEQYLWQYKRFKTRPEGEQRFYNKSK